MFPHSPPRFTPHTDRPGTARTAPPESQPATGSPRIPGLDGLRAIAVIAVLGYHLFPAVIPAGLLGVDIFFVLSGFLITGLLLREWHATGTIGLANFWRRRIRRLVPAAAAVLLVCSSAAAVMGGDVLVGLGRQLLGALTYSSNWLAIANGSDYFAQGAPELFTHFWSLALEEQFYLVWPLLFLLIVATVPRPLHRAAAAVGLAAASAIAATVLAMLGASASRIYYGTDTHLYGLMLGASLALLLPHGLGSAWPFGDSPVRRATFSATGGPGRLATVVLRLRGPVAVGSLAGLLLLIWQPDGWLHDGAQQLGSLFTVGVIQSLLGPETPLLGMLRRGLSLAPLRWLGQRSYGIYLWHWPLLVLLHYRAPRLDPLLTGLLVVGLSLALAAASYRWLEEPIRRNGLRVTALRWATARHPARRRPRLLTITAGIAVALAISGTATAVIQAPPSTALEQQLDGAKSALAAQPSLAPTSPPDSATDPPGLLPPVTPPAQPPSARRGETMTLIGDSVALAAAGALQEDFPGIYIDAKVNRSMAAGAGIIDQMARAGTLRPILVVALATNATFPLSTIKGIEATAGPGRKVIFVNSMAPADIVWAGQANQVLAEAAQTVPNVKIADWHAAIGPHLDLLAADGVHPGPEGARIYTQTIASTLDAP